MATGEWRLESQESRITNQESRITDFWEGRMGSEAVVSFRRWVFAEHFEGSFQSPLCQLCFVECQQTANTTQHNTTQQTVLYCTVLYCTALSSIGLDWIELDWIELYCIVTLECAPIETILKEKRSETKRMIVLPTSRSIVCKCQCKCQCQCTCVCICQNWNHKIFTFCHHCLKMDDGNSEPTFQLQFSLHCSHCSDVGETCWSLPRWFIWWEWNPYSSVWLVWSDNREHHPRTNCSVQDWPSWSPDWLGSRKFVTNPDWFRDLCWGFGECLA
jgi:hypothetical protein